MGPGTLYDNLKKMMDGGLVADAPAAADAGDERRFYRLTVDGGSVLAAEVDRLERVVEEARLRLQGEERGGCMKTTGMLGLAYRAIVRLPSG